MILLMITADMIIEGSSCIEVMMT